MKPFRERNPFVVGAVGLAVLGVLVYGAFNASDLPLIGGGTTYAAQFSEAGGLRPSDEVRVAGVRVGAVEDVELDGDHVRVAFKVEDDDVRLGKETGASIRIRPPAPAGSTRTSRSPGIVRSRPTTCSRRCPT
jgi:phospholipid/cholesterol/gamma-HCH transport system substrate-binding protein